MNVLIFVMVLYVMFWIVIEFEVCLCVFELCYYIYYLFNWWFNSGVCLFVQICGWVVNCFYYQICILFKDVVILLNCFDCDMWCCWIQWLIDYDGQGDNVGGIEVWVWFGEVCGLMCDELWLFEYVLFGVCFVVDVYVNFVWCVLWQEVVCLLLIEMFVLQIYFDWFVGWLLYYLWIELVGLYYFCSCVLFVQCDVEYGFVVMFVYFMILDVQQCVFGIL